MTGPNDQAAVAVFPELIHVVALREAGWQFLLPHLADGYPTQLDGFRVWLDGWTDAIRIRGGDDALGLRCDNADPPGIVWERAGTLVEVAIALLALPAPGDQLAPRLVVGRAPTLWTP